MVICSLVHTLISLIDLIVVVSWYNCVITRPDSRKTSNLLQLSWDPCRTWHYVSLQRLKTETWIRAHRHVNIHTQEHHSICTVTHHLNKLQVLHRFIKDHPLLRHTERRRKNAMSERQTFLNFGHKACALRVSSQLLQPWACLDHMRRSKQEILDHSQRYRSAEGNRTSLCSLYLICTLSILADKNSSTKVESLLGASHQSKVQNLFFIHDVLIVWWWKT